MSKLGAYFLVDAAALDMHCFVALVNNRAYGDSRVRIQYKDALRRDTVRVQVGLADYFVVAELDIAATPFARSESVSTVRKFSELGQ